MTALGFRGVFSRQEANQRAKRGRTGSHFEIDSAAQDLAGNAVL
jgi:hypothetical protein